MGCCQSTPVNEDGCRSRSELPPVPDACFPDKVGYGGVKVLASFASSGSGSSNGRTHTRLIIGPDWIFGGLFEAHGGSELNGGSGSCHDTAARFCAAQCYAEFQRATEGARPAAAAAATRKDASGTESVLVATLKALDRRFLSDDSVPPEERLTSGCTGVLLHVALGETPVATVASLGPCSAVVGQRRGGLASATSEPLVLCGGAATSHDALQGFLSALAAEQRQLASSRAPSKASASSARKRKPSSASSSSGTSQGRLVGPAAGAADGGLQPVYNSDPAAPQALGFGCAKGLRLVPVGRGAPADEPPEAVMGLEVQTASHALGPVDDCLVLLSGGAAAGITPQDVALLMHRMGRLAAIPYEAKPRPLPQCAAHGPAAVQLDNLGEAGPSPAAPPPPTAPIAIAPFNAARLLVQHAATNAASRRPHNAAALGSQHPAGAMAFALEWPRCSDDSAAAAAASGAAVSAVRAAAEAAASARQRAQYRWQLLRLYYKFPYKRHVAIIDRWHSVFDRVMGEAKQLAKQKERSAWTRLNAAVKVTPGGNVQCLAARDPAVSDTHDAVARTPATPGGAARQSRTVAGGIPPASPLRGNSATRQQNYRSRLSAADASAANPYSSPGGPVAAAAPAAGGSSAIPRSPGSAGGSSGTRQRATIAALNSARQRSPSLAAAATPRCASAREARSPPSPAAGCEENFATQAPAAAAAAARRASLPMSPPQYRPVGLLEAEGIEMRDGSVQRLRSGAATSDGGRERAPSASPSLADMPSQRSSAAPAAGPAPTAAVLSSPPSAADDARANDNGSEPGGKSRADGAAGPGDDGAAGHAHPCASPDSAVGPPVASPADAAVTAVAAESARSASQPASGGAATGCAAQSAVAPPAATVSVNSPGNSGIPAALETTSPRMVASPRTAAAATTRIPSLSAGGAPVSSSPARSGIAAGTAAAATSPTASRARAASQATPRSSIPTAIPTLQLQPAAAAAAAAAHSTPRLSMPGGIPTFQRTPPSASAGGAAATTRTPPTRGSNTWGGAPGAGDTPTTATNAAPNSARSGSSRLPRPANLSATMPARSGGGGAAPAASPAGSAVSSRSPFASGGGGGDVSSATKAATAPRPPRLDVPSSSVVLSLAAAEPTPGGGDEADLFSPDAEQLGAWAAEALNVITASATKKQPTPQTPPQQQQLATKSSGQQQQRQDPGTSGGRGNALTPSGSGKSLSIGRTGGSGASGGSAKPALASRIPLSPRHPNANANSGNANSSNPLSRTPSHGSVGKSVRALSPSASLSAGVEPAASGDLSASGRWRR